MEEKNERLKKLSAHGMTLEELIRCVMSADPKPLREQEKEERKRKEAERAKKSQKRRT